MHWGRYLLSIFENFSVWGNFFISNHLCLRQQKFKIQIHAFFISSTFINNVRMKLAKNQANAKQYPEAELYYLKIIHILYPCYHPKMIVHILKVKQKKK